MSWWSSISELVSFFDDQGLNDEQTVRALVTTALEQEPAGVPWYVRTGLAIASWFAAFIILGTCTPLAMLSEHLLIAVGLIVALMATVARWVRPASASIYVDHICFASVLAGRGLFVGGLVGALGVGGSASSTLPLVLMALGIELVALVAYPDRIHRGLSTLVSCGLMVGVLFTAQDLFNLTKLVDVFLGLCLPVAVVLLMSRHLVAFSRLRNVIEPVTVGLAIFGLASMARFWTGWAEESWVVAVSGATGALTLGVVAFTLYRVGASWHGWFVGLFGALVVVVLGLGLPGLAAALSLVLISLLVRDLTLLFYSLLALVCYGSWAFSFIDLPVLLKGGALIGTGLLLLAMRVYMLRVVPREVES